MISDSGRATTLFVSSEWAIAAEPSVEVAQPREHVVEPSVGEVTVRLEDEGIDLVAEAPRLAGERQHVLDRAVVQIEPEAHQPFLTGCDERPLAPCIALEQVLALENRRERRCCRLEIGGDVPPGIAEDTDHDRAGRGSEPLHLSRAKARLTDEREAAARRARRFCGSADPPRGGVGTERQDALDLGAVDATPDGRLGRDVEVEQERQLDLGSHGRGKLEERRAGTGPREEIEGCDRERLGECVCESRGDHARVVGLELALGRKAHHHVRCVRRRGEGVGSVTLTCSPGDPARPEVSGGEDGREVLGDSVEKPAVDPAQPVGRRRGRHRVVTSEREIRDRVERISGERRHRQGPEPLASIRFFNFPPRGVSLFASTLCPRASPSPSAFGGNA